ncbi:hypothetical protein M9H77_28793 [Catharanthus roseus]|uniref:Uncharacterized protein n=1 Tax=Catharanthus roseus TaxID=4058 RepID=A0ACC0AI04_CATRO|nr:hypothetical protein M9H77_28793 [Catharanthus roseus]
MSMVPPSGRRGDDDFGPVMDRTGRIDGHTVTTSSRGVRGRNSTSDLPATPTPLAPGFHHCTGEPGSSTQPPAVPFRSQPPLQPHLSHTPVPYEPYGSTHSPSPLQTQYMIYTYMLPLYDLAYHIDLPPKSLYWSLLMLGTSPQDSSCSTHGYSHTEYGVSSYDPCVPRPADRVCEDDMGFEGDRGLAKSKKESDPYILRERRMREDEGDDAGDEEQPVFMAPASGSNGRPRHGKGKGLTGSFMSVMIKIAGSRSWFIEVPIALHGTHSFTLLPLVDRLYCHIVSELPAIYSISRVVHSSVIRVATLFLPDYGHCCRMNLGQMSRVDAKEHAGCWSLFEAWIYLYFPMFAPPVRPGTEACMPYILQFPMLRYKNENKLLDIRLRLNMMTADEVRWISYRTQEIRACWVSTWHGFIAYFDCVEP